MDITSMGALIAQDTTPRPMRALDSADRGTDTGATVGRGRAKGAPRTDFSALLALLAGADIPMAPSAGLSTPNAKPSTDESANPAALLDQLLEQVEPGAISSEQTADMLRYGILKDTGASAPAAAAPATANRAQLTEVLGRLAGRRGTLGAGSATTSAAADTKALDALMALMARANMATANGVAPVTDPAQLLSQLLDGGFGGAELSDEPTAALLGSARAGGTGALAAGRRGTTDTARINELLGRITGRRGGAATKDALTALGLTGDGDRDELRAGLEALLARANAANAATNVAAAGSATATTATAVRDTAALAPELQQKLGRVVQRMKTEFGHDVTVVETVRSQARQDALYEQGRTQPGAVVTWTRDSAHTRGEAVDVQIDGAYTNAQGFARLQQIAAEEGLRTLGPRDPGHLELANGARGGNAGLGAGMTTVAPMTVALMQGPAGMARVAGVAGVAGMAGVAGIAQPASLAGTAGRSATGGGSDSGAFSDPNSSDSALSSLLRRSGRRSSATDDRTATPAPSSSAATPMVSTPAGVVPTAGPAGVASAERVADLQALRDSAPAGTVSRLTMTVDAPDGGQDRITIGMRGSAIETHISTDASSADQLRLRTGALQEALGRQGLDADTVRISAGARTERPEAMRSVFTDREAVAAALSQQSASGDNSGFQGQRERSAAARDWDRQDNSRQSRDARANDRDATRDGEGRRSRRDATNQDKA